MLSSLTVSAMRNTRRSGSTILDQARTANRHLTEQFAHEEFVTGLLLQIDVLTGQGFIVNAGHPPPLLLREEAVSIVNLFPDTPLGLSADTDYQLQAHPTLIVFHRILTKVQARPRAVMNGLRWC